MSPKLIPPVHAMKYCRFELADSALYGLVETVGGQEMITHSLDEAPEIGIAPRARYITPLALQEVTLLPAVCPSKIVCVGRNYRDHAAELGNAVPLEPLLFFKPPSSLLGHGGTILRPTAIAQRTDYEGELGIVIGKRCHKLADDEEVRSYILGYTCVNDFTARDLQNKDGQWTRAKGFDTFCPVGPLVTTVGIDPWQGVTVQTYVNGEVRQSGNTRDFIFPLDLIIRYISQTMTLEPGDLIATGTPSGVGPVVAGDVIEVRVEGVGTLRNSVADQ